MAPITSRDEASLALKEVLNRLALREDLTRVQMRAVFEHVLGGHATPAQLGALLMALRLKGETPEEIAAAAEVMRARATPIRVPAGRVIVDTCGTGGDGAQTFNISTAGAFVVAGAGATVAKHGNRSVSSQSGSADVLSAAGVRVDVPVAVVEACLASVGIGFLFAPSLHEGMGHVSAIRREIGVRSIFNLLGPLSNPARATHQLMGVYDRALVPVVAHTLARLGIERALVVHGEDGLDEVSPTGPTRAAWVQDGAVRLLTLTPESAGIAPVKMEEIRGGDARHNAVLMRNVLAGEDGPMRRTVLLNAGAALWVAGMAEDFQGGVALASQSIDRGHAEKKLEQLIALTAQKAEAKG
jgi:anthranilate phosphoribosyltransferase